MNLVNTVSKKLLYVLFCIFLQISTVSASEKIIIAGDYWCPYNCIPGTDNPGYLVEMISYALASENIQVEYVMMPWQDALRAVNNDEIHAIIAASKEEGENLILTSSPLATSEIGVYTRGIDNWVLDGLQSLKGKTVCLIAGHDTDGIIKQYIMDNYIVSPNLFMIENTRLASVDCVNNLLDGNVDLVVDSDKVVDFVASDAGVSRKLKRVGTAGKTDLYIAFSPNSSKSKEYLDLLESALTDMQNTTKLKQIAKKYGI